MKKEKAITLISLVITIVVLIILASVAIYLSLGNNGIFTRAKQAKEQYLEASAREKLEIVLLNARTEKEVNDKYDSEEFLNGMLEEKDMQVDENSVIVDNYVYLIDREKLVITDSLGETKIKVTKEIKNYIGKNENGKYEVEILLIVESNNEIKEVTIEKPDGTTLKLETDKLKLGKDLTIELDEEYKVIIVTNDEKTETRKIIEKSEETIRTVEELVAFREKVNTGLTYEGKTINLVADLDLSSVCYKVDGTVENDKSWEPIGNYQEQGENSTHIFKGTFKGNYHKIENLYINSDKNYQGLFGYVQNATITGVVVDGIKDKESIEEDSEITSIKGKSYVAGIIGYANNTTIKNCGNNANIISSDNYVGGIVGYVENNSKIEGVYNKGNILSNGAAVGGIIGKSEYSNFPIQYNYNLGKVTGKTNVGGINGFSTSNIIYNSYNLGNITSEGKGNEYGVTGGINGGQDQNSTIMHCYNLGNVENKNTKYGYVGGISGLNRSITHTPTSTKASLISYCYNSGDVSSNGTYIGGVCGKNEQYCKIGNCYISNIVTVKTGTTKATANIGSSSSFLGKLIGFTYENNSTYINNVELVENENMPIVYEVVNANEESSLDNGDSMYWSKTDYSNENFKTPKLKWESNAI